MTAHFGRPHSRLQSILAISAMAAAAALASACGSAATPGSGSLPTLPGGTVGSPGATPGPTSGSLGDTLSMEDSGDDIANVTMTKVFDPVTVTDSSEFPPPDGTRWVGFEGTIVINGARSGSDSTDVVAVGSDGQTYGPDNLPAFDGCTPTPDDAAVLPSGTTQTFCAGVGLPQGVTVAKIGYTTAEASTSSNGLAPPKLFWSVDDSIAPVTTATPTATPTASTNASTNTTGHVGDTLSIEDSGGDAVHVTLVQILDPATGVNPDDTPPDGTRWVGFDLTVVVDGGSASDVSDTVDVIGSDGKTYGFSTAYHLTAMAGCTATSNDASGQTDTFCAGVGLPPGVTVAQVGYSTAGVDSGSAAQVSWTVP